MRNLGIFRNIYYIFPKERVQKERARKERVRKQRSMIRAQYENSVELL